VRGPIYSDVFLVSSGKDYVTVIMTKKYGSVKQPNEFRVKWIYGGCILQKFIELRNGNSTDQSLFVSTMEETVTLDVLDKFMDCKGGGSIRTDFDPL